jgi:hypothetical protein
MSGASRFEAFGAVVSSRVLEPLAGEVGADRVLMLDAAPNWFSVSRALDAMIVGTHALDLPLTVVPEIAWPFGRRDSYPSLHDVPPGARHPSRRLGVRPLTSVLVDGGAFSDRENCVFEFGSRNGVLTAVEDFVRRLDDAVRCVQIDGFVGVALVFGVRLLASAPLLERLVTDRDATLAELGVHRALADAQLARETSKIREVQHRAREAVMSATRPASLASTACMAWPPHPGGDALRSALRVALVAQPILAQLLRLVDETLVRGGVPYSVDFGTLLGLVRHGSLIPHDDDVDIAVPASQFERCLEVLEAAGFPCGAVHTMGADRPATGWVAFPTNDPLVHGYWAGAPVVDIFPVDAQSGGLRPEDFATVARQPFIDFEVSAPRDARAAIGRWFEGDPLSEVRVYSHAAFEDEPLVPRVLGLREYARICDEEGYRPPRTV